MLKSLIRQLNVLSLDPSIRSLWNQHQNPGSEPSTKELMDTIWRLIDSRDHDVFIVFDALDECPVPERDKLLDFIKELWNRGNGKVHILATSRQEPDIKAKLEKLHTIAVDIEHLIKNDIVLFVQATLLEDDRLSRWDNSLKNEIREKLTAVDETYVKNYSIYLN